MFEDCTIKYLPSAVLSIFLFVLGFGIYRVEAHWFIDFADEAFLWYGAQRVALGEVPILDFMSYDPGRYYWASTFFSLFHGDGVLLLRACFICFAVLGTLFSAFCLARLENLGMKSTCFFAGCLLILLTTVRTHVTDATMALLLVVAIANLLKVPNMRSAFLGGLTIGIAGVFGRNHAFYGFIGEVLAFGVLFFTQANFSRPKLIFSWVAGIGLGYSPLLLMFATIPGFFKSFIDGLIFLFESKKTNVSIGFPMPWDAFAKPFPWLFKAHLFLLGLYFWMLPAFAIAGLIFTSFRLNRRKPVHPVIVSSFCLSLPYAHHAFSRADGAHLSVSLVPMIVGLLFLAGIGVRGKTVSRKLVIALLGLSLVVFLLPLRPLGMRMLMEKWESVDLNGEMVRNPLELAERDRYLLDLSRRYITSSHSVFAAPNMCGVYAIFRQKAPVWEIYPFFKHPAEFEENELKKLKLSDPKIFLLDNFALDGNEEYRYSVTHPLICDYIHRNYRKLILSADRPNSQLEAFVKQP